MNEIWVMPRSIYTKFPFSSIVSDLKEWKYDKIHCEADSLLSIKFNEDLIVCMYDDGSLMIKFTGNIGVEDLDLLISKYESLIKEYIDCFKFVLPEDVLNHNILRILNKCGKLSGTIESPLFSDRECIKKLTNLFK